MISDLFLIIICKLCDNCCIHPIQCATKLCIFEHHRFQWCITGTLSDSKKWTVHTARTIKPCCRWIADCLIEIIMSVKFDQFAWNTGMYSESIDDSRNRSWYYSSRIVDPVSHGITDTDLDRNLILIHQFHKFQTEWNDESIDVGTCDIFQMTSRADSCLKTFSYDRQIMFHCLTSCHL